MRDIIFFKYMLLVLTLFVTESFSQSANSLEHTISVITLSPSSNYRLIQSQLNHAQSSEYIIFKAKPYALTSHLIKHTLNSKRPLIIYFPDNFVNFNESMSAFLKQFLIIGMSPRAYQKSISWHRFNKNDSRYVMAKNLDNLIKQLPHSESVTFRVIHLDNSIWIQALEILAKPMALYTALLLGFSALFIEALFFSGFYLGGLGFITIILIASIWHVLALPISIGLLFLLSFVLLIIEVLMFSYGMFWAIGSILFVTATVRLFSEFSVLSTSFISLIITLAILSCIIFMAITLVALKIKKKPDMHGLETLIGKHGRALTEINMKGSAIISGEIWQVEAHSLIKKDQAIVVTACKGLKLFVRPK